MQWWNNSGGVNGSRERNMMPMHSGVERLFSLLTDELKFMGPAAGSAGGDSAENSP
jgi:hypothetical protein